MKQLFLTLSTALLLFACTTKQPVNYVDPMIGTGATGHTFPGAIVPFGMVQLSPDQRTQGWQYGSGYHESDSTILGFSHTHLSGTGITDLGDILLVPTTGKVKTVPGRSDLPGSGYRSRFSHDNETSVPGYYQVFLQDHKVNVELTTTKRAGFHRYTFPQSDSANIIIDLKHGLSDRPTDLNLKVVSNNEIEGTRLSTGWARGQHIYFVAKFSKPFDSYGIVNSGKDIPGLDAASGVDLQAYVNYKTEENEAILVKVGISAVSIKNARKNLEAEIVDWDFEKIRSNANDEWNTALSKYSVEGGTEDQKTIFYTAFYHTMIQPSLYSDVDGSYRGRDRKVHKTDGFNMYTTFSLWDTYRAQNPLFTIIDTTMVSDWISSFLREYQEGGLLPSWSFMGHETGIMIGYHALPIIADAYMKGIRDFDPELALEAMKFSTTRDRAQLKEYKEYGFIPSKVSRTLEYAYDDWCVAQMAKDLGKTDDYKTYIRRAQYYRNMYDPSTGFMRGKDGGKWYTPFNPKEVSNHYTEANAWQYSFYVPHDVSGLVELFGGKEAFIEKLDQLFVEGSDLDGHQLPDITGMKGQYVHGNEPSHQIAYMYNFVGEPWKTQKMVSFLCDTMYMAEPAGLAGNDDCGQMSAWYVFSAMGFYPVAPGDNNYIIGSPIFKKTTVNLANGKQMVIKAKGVSKENVYIQSAQLNGKPYNKSFITHQDLMAGGELAFVMGAEPNKKWGTNPEDLPISKIEDINPSVPYFTNTDKMFTDTINIGIGAFPRGATIYYTTDGSEPTEKSLVYSGSILLNNTTTIKAFSEFGNERSKTSTLVMEKAKWFAGKNVPNLKQGLRYKYYEAYVRNIPDFSKLKALKTGVAKNFNISHRLKEDNFLFTFTGYVEVPENGIYTFYLRSDDGSKLKINNQLVIDHDGPHGPTEKRGQIALKAGKHAIVVEYMEITVGETLEVYWEGPGIKKQRIPNDKLFY